MLERLHTFTAVQALDFTDLRTFLQPEWFRVGEFCLFNLKMLPECTGVRIPVCLYIF